MTQLADIVGVWTWLDRDKNARLTPSGRVFNLMNVRPISLRTELARERAVDLDLVGREAAERGIAGAEIVHRDADAELAGLLPDSAKRWNRFGNRTGRNSP